MLLKTNGSESVNSRQYISAFIKKYSYMVLQLLKCPLHYIPSGKFCYVLIVIVQHEVR